MRSDRVKRRMREILTIPSAPGDFWGSAFDAFIITLIVLNTLAVIVETIPGAIAGYEDWVTAFEWLSIAVFAVEYFLRIWSITTEPGFAHPVRGRLKWMATPFAVIDLLAILPALLFAVDLRFLRVLRVLRILKLGRYSESVLILGNVLKRSRRELLTSLFVVLLALLVVSSFMYYAEREAQPDVFASIPHAMYWGIIALTTTGYGDVVPITTPGRVLAGVAALLGVAAIALPVGILSSSFVQEIEARRVAKRKADDAAESNCPHCGKDIKHPKA